MFSKRKRKIATHTWVLFTTEYYHYRSNSYVFWEQSTDFCISDLSRAGDRRAPGIEWRIRYSYLADPYVVTPHLWFAHGVSFRDNFCICGQAHYLYFTTAQSMLVAEHSLGLCPIRTQPELGLLINQYLLSGTNRKPKQMKQLNKMMSSAMRL